MMASKLQLIDDFQRVVSAFSGHVLPEFGIACRRLTFGDSMNAPRPFVIVSKRIRAARDAAAHVIRRTNLSVRRTETIKLSAPKSP
jgi:hypothetical protein